MLNLGDCKHVGVYHEKRVAATYPIRIRIAVERNGKFRFSYSFPQLPKKIFSYNSEAGTYAGKTSLETLPSVEDRRTIKTLPSQFVVIKLVPLNVTYKLFLKKFKKFLCEKCITCLSVFLLEKGQLWYDWTAQIRKDRLVWGHPTRPRTNPKNSQRSHPTVHQALPERWMEEEVHRHHKTARCSHLAHS